MESKTFTAFVGDSILESGDIETVLEKAKYYVDAGGMDRLAIYDDQTGYIIDIDFRGTLQDVLIRLPDHPRLSFLKEKKEDIKRGRGRPKLGVVSREVTLLPRHWEWLSKQKGGASVTLRRLVDYARKKEHGKEIVEDAKLSIHRFMWDMTYDLENFEDVNRAFYQGDYANLSLLIYSWPKDIKSYLLDKISKLNELEKLL